MKQTKKQKYREWKDFLKDDKDYDWAYIIRLLKYNLERVEQDDYLDEALKVLEKKYGKRNLKMKTKPSLKKNVSEVNFASNSDKLPPSQRGAAKRSLKASYARSEKKSN